METIDLKERSGYLLQFQILEMLKEYVLDYNINLEYDSSNSLHENIKTAINDKYHLSTDEWKDIEIISLVILREDDTTNLPDPIIGLLRLDNGLTSNCLVVTMDEQLNILHKPKRTTGKVSNTLG